MDFGLTVFSTDASIRPGEVAQAAEESGFSLLYFPDHTHVPVERKSPWPGGGEMPAEYARIFDPLVATSEALSATRTLRVGPGVCLVAQRDPIILAKQVSSLDYLSGGRVLLGVGAGWSAEEAASHGIEPRSRWDVMREHVLAMRQIWSCDVASFDGDYVGFPALRSWPKPLQEGGPLVLVGGGGPRVLDRVLEYGDGWYASPGPGQEPFANRLAGLRRAAHERGLLPPTIHVQVFGEAPPVRVIEKYRAAGVDGIVLSVPSVDRDRAMKVVESHAALVKSIT